MAKKSSRIQRNTKTTPRKQTSWWRRYGRFVILAAALLITTIIFFTAPHDENQSRFNAITPTITTSDFTDDNYLTFSENASVPDVNNNRKISTPQTWYVGYDLTSGPRTGAFKMGITDADLRQNIQITPFIRGTWQTRGPNVIEFTPESDWPTDKKFSIKIGKNLFNPDAHVDARRFTFSTPAISDNVVSFATYPAPNATKSVVAVAIVEFSAPINTKHFSDKVSLKLDDAKLPFDVKFDTFHRTAFITSAPIEITDAPQVVRLKINRVSAADKNSATKKITANTTIESADNIFKIASITSVAADDTNGDAQQLILINTTTAATPATEWGDAITAYLLPQHKPDSDNTAPDTSHHWLPDEITHDVLSNSEKLTLTPIDFATTGGMYQYAFSYDVSAPTDRYIYVTINNDIKSAAGFVLQNPSYTVLRVAYPERTVKIAGRGAILSMSGDKKLGIMARGGADTAYINVYKIKDAEINHLISQTYNVFADALKFKSWSFGEYDMATVFQKAIPFANTSVKQTNYASLDLNDYLGTNGTDKTGIFLIQTGTDERHTEYNDKRLILLTDLGIIRKVDINNESTIFVSNITTGKPSANISVSVLGRNGTPIFETKTDKNGVCKLPHFPWSEYRNAREPVAIVARHGSDVSFIPYNNYTIRNDYSRFDTGGEYTYNTSNINAFVFSDRGIYRPAEVAIIAGIIKNTQFSTPSGVPVKLEIRDARGRIALERTFSVSTDGMFDVKYTIAPNAPLGEYIVNLYSLTDKNNPDELLGQTTLQIAEFTPDTLKINATLANGSENGWVSPADLSINVSLRNLFGTPATNNRVTATATLHPVAFSFPEYDDYVFGAHNTTPNAQNINVKIAPTYTDTNGTAKMGIFFDAPVPAGTYQLNANVRGNIGESGTGTQTNIFTRVSSAEYLVGYHTNSDLEYLKRDTAHDIHLIALDANAEPVALKNLTLRTVARENLTSLVKDYNEYYKYQTITRDRIVSEKTIEIPTDGLRVPLDTTTGGTYFIQVINRDGNILSNTEYFVESDKNSQLLSDTTAELKIKLDAPVYAAGTDINVNITAPYAGSGLITIERDRVYAYKWFTSDTTSSVQQITLPAEFSGTGYVNVSYVRAGDSRDIFTAPYAFAAAPFSTNVSHAEIDIELTAPKTISDNKLTVEYETDKSGRIMIFAINTGILQVAKYHTPNPIKYFFKKSALQVDTYQILSLLLPEYKILREFAKTGGGDYAGINSEMNQILTNPFGRRGGAPVAFYSGILDVTADTRDEYTFDIPDDFNGELSIFAVAASDTSTGSAITKTAVQSPIVISATAPNATAPNDEFDINAVISNLTRDSGENARAEISISATGPIEITSPTSTQFALAENEEQLSVFHARATDEIGNSEIVINVRLFDEFDNEIATRTTKLTTSVRPTATYSTVIKTGALDSRTTKIAPPMRDLYPEFAQQKMYISANASAAMYPMFAYLNEYEYPCSEQIVSRALPYALAPSDAILGTTYDASRKQISDTIATLKNRQNDDGSFDLWTRTTIAYDDAPDAHTAYLTAYIAHFMTIARENGFNVPTDMLSRGIDYLRTFAAQTITDDEYARATAYAIYVITRNGYVSTNYIDTFTEYANKNISDWRESLMGAYIAASYKLLRQDDLADKLIAEYEPATTRKFVYTSTFDNNIANNAIYAYLANRHFGGANRTMLDKTINAYTSSGDYNSFTSAAIILALSGKNSAVSATLPSITLTSNGADIATATSDAQLVANLSDVSRTVTVTCPDCSDENAPYYSILSQGYPRESRRASNGIEIVREYFDMNGNRITSGNVGDTVTVQISARTRGATKYVSNAVIVDLLPGGFVVNPDTITGDSDFYEIRSDRVLIFTPLSRETYTITYTAQLGAAGTFAIPAIAAESMYNPAINATGTTGTFTVNNNAEIQQ